MKFIVTNDWHLSSRAPSSRLDNYQDELFELLDQIQKLALKLHAHVVVPGDIFHTAGGVSWGLFLRLIQWAKPIKDAGLQIIAVAGNHDLKFNRLDTLDDLPLGVLFRMGVFENVDSFAAKIDGVTFVGVPFPTSFEQRIWTNFESEVGTPRDRPAVLLTHCFAAPAAGEFFGEPVWGYGDLAKLPFDVFCFGHDHSDGGVVEVEGKFFINLGALSRGSIAHDDVNRDIKVALVEIPDPVVVGALMEPKPPTITVQQIRLNYRPAEEIFDLKRKAELDAEKAQIVQFVETLDAQLTTIPAADTLSDRVGRLGLSNAVRERVLVYLDDANG